MKKPLKFQLFLFSVLAAGSCFLYGWQRNSAYDIGIKNDLRVYLVAEMDSILSILDRSAQSDPDTAELRRNYHTARRHYKHIEWFVEIASPVEAKYYINGPLVTKYSEYAQGQTVEPHGFQRIEELLYQDTLDQETLVSEYRKLHANLKRLRDVYGIGQVDEGMYLEMCQLHLLRICALNLNGYDATITKTNIRETAWSLEGVEEVLRYFIRREVVTPEIKRQSQDAFKLLDKTRDYLLAHPDYDSFDRLYFMTRFVLPLNEKLIALHDATGLGWSERKQAVNLREKNLFGPEALNSRYFSIYYDDTTLISEQAALGKILFYDPVLSSNNQRACSSCHKPGSAFADGLPLAVAFDPAQKLSRNAPSILDVMFQKAFFHDGRSYQMEQQAFEVFHNAMEMNTSTAEIVAKLRQSEEYRALFRQAFSHPKDADISEYAILKALVEYEKTLVSFNSRFDHYLQGNYKVLSDRERNGYNLFAGKALCGSCHFFPVFNGTVPPLYFDSEFEVIGTPETSENKKLDSDIGRYQVTRLDIHRNAFKTPTVRNAELTAPYMHNGVYTRLEDVVKFYQKGGGAGFNYVVDNQTLPFDSLQITTREEEDIVLFLKSLTDTSGTFTRPFKLPAFPKETGWNTRTWGGDY